MDFKMGRSPPNMTDRSEPNFAASIVKWPTKTRGISWTAASSVSTAKRFAALVFPPGHQAIAHWVRHPSEEEGAMRRLHNLCFVFVANYNPGDIKGAENIETVGLHHHARHVVVSHEKQCRHLVRQALYSLRKFPLLGGVRAPIFERIPGEHRENLAPGSMFLYWGRSSRSSPCRCEYRRNGACEWGLPSPGVLTPIYEILWVYLA